MSNEDLAHSHFEHARDDFEFLVSSWNRFEVLQAIASAPKTRNELREGMDVSRVTLSRILSDLETRGWIVRNDNEHEVTATGRLVANEFTETFETLQTVHQLGEHAAWMQFDKFDFELSRLQDATVITPTWDDFSAYSDTMVEVHEASTHVNSIATGIDRRAAKAFRDAVAERDLSLQLVYTPELLAIIRDDPDLSALFRDLVTSDQVTLYRYLGETELMMLGMHETRGEREDVVMLCGEHDEGAPPGTILTTDSDVWSWAESFFQDRRSESEQVQLAAFTA